MSLNGQASDILGEVLAERERQDVLKAEGKFQKTCADAMSNVERLAVLAEEFGEVAHEVCDAMGGFTDWYAMREELIQVAAVCVAWVEGLDRQKEPRNGLGPDDFGINTKVPVLR